MSDSRKGGWQMVMMPPPSQWAVDGCVKPHEWKISEQDIMNMSFYVFLSTQNVSAGRPRAIRVTQLKKSQNIKNECWYSSLCLSDKLFSQCRERFLFGKTQKTRWSGFSSLPHVLLNRTLWQHLNISCKVTELSNKMTSQATYSFSC